MYLQVALTASCCIQVTATHGALWLEKPSRDINYLLCQSGRITAPGSLFRSFHLSGCELRREAPGPEMSCRSMAEVRREKVWTGLGENRLAEEEAIWRKLLAWSIECSLPEDGLTSHDSAKLQVVTN